jgi:arginyl-tRNA synthetase
LLSVAPNEADTSIHIERPKQASHGDFSCNLAMQLARSMKRNPRQLAQLLVSELPYSPLVDKTDIAGAGFINFHLRPAAKLEVVRAVLEQGEAFGRSTTGGKRKVLVEFVSANPTGPLHVGHGRGAAYGGSLCKLLAFAGWDVTSEYYVNDAGRQMDILACRPGCAIWSCTANRMNPCLFRPTPTRANMCARWPGQMLAAHGERFLRAPAGVIAGTPALPDPGRTDAAAAQSREAHLDALIANAKRLLGEDWKYVHDFVLTEQLADCRSDLEESACISTSGSPKSRCSTPAWSRVRRALQKAGHLYEQDGALLVPVDRFRRREGSRRAARKWPLHLFRVGHRLSPQQVRAWLRADHQHLGRRPPRLHSARQGRARRARARSRRLEVALVQFAVLYRSGQKAQMSTRSGEFVTLRTLREDVGNDACRFFYVLRKSDQHLDFDLDLAKSQSNDNPVYYIQYAHARVCSLLALWGGDPEPSLAAPISTASTGRMNWPWPPGSANSPRPSRPPPRELAPHLIAFYLKDLAAEFHSYYNAERMLVDDTALKRCAPRAGGCGQAGDSQRHGDSGRQLPGIDVIRGTEDFHES